MTLIQFPEQRATAPNEAVCSCGGMWFRPVRVAPDGTELDGALLLNRNGTVQSYAGVMRCTDCGDDYKP